MGKIKKRDPIQEAIRSWLKEGHSPNELYQPVPKSSPKKKPDKTAYEQYRIVPNQGSIKVIRGGSCSGVGRDKNKKK